MLSIASLCITVALAFDITQLFIKKYMWSSPILHYECWAWSWSQFLDSQPASDLVINPIVGCCYFPPGRSYFPSQRVHPLAGTKLYCLVREAHRCKYLVQGHYTKVSSQDSNLQPVNRRSLALPISQPCLQQNGKESFIKLFFLVICMWLLVIL